MPRSGRLGSIVWDWCRYWAQCDVSSVYHEPPWYGTVCPVVWEDGGSNPASYPMLSWGAGDKKWFQPHEIIEIIVSSELQIQREA